MGEKDGRSVSPAPEAATRRVLVCRKTIRKQPPLVDSEIQGGRPLLARNGRAGGMVVVFHHKKHKNNHEKIRPMNMIYITWGSCHAIKGKTALLELLAVVTIK